MVWQKGYKLQGGRYVIEKVLGEGGFGITYQAQHTLLKQWVVIKTPNEILKNDSEYPNYVKRFIQEGRKLAQLSQQPHPNIVRVTELFEDGKTYCLVMDFVPGESLFNLVQKQGALPELKAVEYIKQIGEALIFVHHQGLVHRDAHPGNIMVQKNGKAVLIDFGIAGEIMPQDGYFTSHHPANIAFAPYEQMGGNRQVTIDVYTLAASLYYAVTGKRPESSLDRKLYNKPLIPPNKYVVGISDSLNLAILKGMNLEAEYRPQSMREWLKLLPDFSNQVYQFSQKIEHQTIRTEKTFPVIVGANNSPNIKVNSKNIPWVCLGVMSLYYLTIGFLSVSSENQAFAIAFTEALACALFFSLPSNLYLINLRDTLMNGLGLPHGYMSIAMGYTFTTMLPSLWLIYVKKSLPWIPDASILVTLIPVFIFPICFIYWSKFAQFILCVMFFIFLAIAGLAGAISWVVFVIFIFIYIFTKGKLETYFSKWHQFLILLGTSWLSLFLGWLTYQLFPIFANR